MLFFTLIVIHSWTANRDSMSHLSSVSSGFVISATINVYLDNVFLSTGSVMVSELSIRMFEGREVHRVHDEFFPSRRMGL